MARVSLLLLVLSFDFTPRATSSLKSVSVLEHCGGFVRADGAVLASARAVWHRGGSGGGDDDDGGGVGGGGATSRCTVTLLAASPRDRLAFRLRLLGTDDEEVEVVEEVVEEEVVVEEVEAGDGLTRVDDFRSTEEPTTRAGCEGRVFLLLLDGAGDASPPLPGGALCPAGGHGGDGHGGGGGGGHGGGHGGGGGGDLRRESTGPALTLSLVLRGTGSAHRRHRHHVTTRLTFLADVTSFRPASDCGRYFRCASRLCVPWALVCDALRLDNCGDQSDEAHCPGLEFVQRGAGLQPTPEVDFPRTALQPWVLGVSLLALSALLLLLLVGCGWAPAWCAWRCAPRSRHTAMQTPPQPPPPPPLRPQL
ncbi:uncharacterized protein LOC144953411 [Lampetra fluviatilis]